MNKKLIITIISLFSLFSFNLQALNINNETNGFEVCKTINMHQDFKKGSKHGTFLNAFENCHLQDNALINNKIAKKFKSMSNKERINYQNSCMCQYVNYDPTGKNNYSFEEDTSTTISNCKDQIVNWEDGLFKCSDILKAAKNNTKQTAFADQSTVNQKIENPIAMEGQAEYICQNGVWNKLEGQETCFRKPKYEKSGVSVNCLGKWNIGNWSSCNEGFKIRNKQFIVEINAYNGGKKCPFENGHIITEKLNCKAECDSYKEEPTYGTCENGYTTKKRIYRVKSGNCPYEDGKEFTDTVDCSNCLGDFFDKGDWSACNDKGETEVLQEYKIFDVAYNGGAECPYKNGEQRINWTNCSNEPVFDCDEELVAAPFTKIGNSKKIPVISIPTKMNDGEIFKYNEQNTVRCGDYISDNKYFSSEYTYNSEFQCQFDGNWKINKSECNLVNKRLACEESIVKTGDEGVINFPDTPVNKIVLGEDSNNCKVEAICNENTGNFEITSKENCSCNAGEYSLFSEYLDKNINFYFEHNIDGIESSSSNEFYKCNVDAVCLNGGYTVKNMTCE